MTYDDWLSAPYDNPPKVDDDTARELAEDEISGYTYHDLVACLPPHKQKVYNQIWENLREEAIEEIKKEFLTN